MIKDTLRLVVISPELVFALLAFCLFSFFPEISNLMARFIFNGSMQIQNYLFLFGIPIGLLVGIYKMGDELQNPNNDGNKKLLKEWPQYWMIKNRVIFSLVVSLIGIIGTFIAWVYAIKIDAFLAMKTILILWSAMLGSFLSIAKAKLDIKDIVY
jgi:glucan phosphoethanolaminetransferase (alkaline phosphatase superfamily)